MIAKPVGAAVKVWPATVKTDVGGEGRGMVDVPIWRPDGPSEIMVPDIVIADPPGEIVWPLKVKPIGAAVKVCPATVNTEAAAVGGRGTVAVPICSPEGPSESTVPDSVIAEPPGDRL